MNGYTEAVRSFMAAGMAARDYFEAQMAEVARVCAQTSDQFRQLSELLARWEKQP